MKNMASFKLILFLFSFSFVFTYATAVPCSRSEKSNSTCLSPRASQLQVYIAYLGEKKHDDHQLTVESHHDLLATVVGSKKLSSELMVHNYKYGFSGFSAKLTKSQARKLAALPDVIHLVPDQAYKPLGTRAPEYLGLTDQRPGNIIQRTNKGDGIIIGVIDTGIWGKNSRGVFSDEGYGPIPSRWKGTCVSVGAFDAAQHCNKKIIGASWHRKGATANGFAPNDTVYDNPSPLDFHGHGTHCASISAGSEVRNVTYLTQYYGTFRGIAPRARLAIYKACYKLKETDHNRDDDCFASDVIDAFDQAIHDGVDVITASIGPQNSHGNDIDNYLNFASYHAVANGISVVAAAGNLGPRYTTMGNTSPWHITVAAARVDEEIVARITLGNNMTVMSVPLSGLQDSGFKKLVSFDNSVLQGWKFPYNYTLTEMVKGKVVFLNQYSNRNAEYEDEKQNAIDLFASAKNLGIIGIIIDINTTNTIRYEYEEYKQVIYMVEKDVARQIDEYIRLTSDPMVNLGKATYMQGKSVRTMIDSYSSRGPSLHTPTILKPDIAAPGSNILGAASEELHNHHIPDNGFVISSGTSQATPVVAGLVALLRAEHPEWSPAAVKSALVTTGSNTDIYGAEIISPWSKSGIAGPLDLGGGIANVNAASNPGLIYDMQPSDYLNYLCGAGYGIDDIKNITSDPYVMCPNRTQAIMDVNVPSIGVSGLVNTLIIKRTVTNVGPEHSCYRAQITPPVGTEVTVIPKVLLFNAKRKKITYCILIKKTQNVETNADGSLTWTDGEHHVRSPIVVLS